MFSVLLGYNSVGFLRVFDTYLTIYKEKEKRKIIFADFQSSVSDILKWL
jgi:hypothetical protein